MTADPQLEPADDYAPMETADGVIFYMRNKATGEIIEFLITHQALRDLDAKNLKRSETSG